MIRKQMTRTSAARSVSLLGAIFCFGIVLFFMFGYGALTFNQVQYYPQSGPVVEAILWVAGSFFIALGLIFLRDYLRS